MSVPQLVTSANVHLALPGALWHVLRLNCVNEPGRYYHANSRRFVHSSPSSLNRGGARPRSRAVTMLAVRPRRSAPHLVPIHCFFRVMKSRLRDWGCLLREAVMKTLLQYNSSLGSEGQIF